jgi:hypothetical protein
MYVYVLATYMRARERTHVWHARTDTQEKTAPPIRPTNRPADRRYTHVYYYCMPTILHVRCRSKLFLKIEAGALLCHIRRDNKVHNTPKRTPPHKQTLNRNKTNPTGTQPSTTRWERRSKLAARTCAVVANAVPRRSATRCRPKRPQSSSTMSLSPQAVQTRSRNPQNQ